MEKEDVKSKLLEHVEELESAGLVHVYLHGSVVRGEAGPDSAVDLAAVFDRLKCKGIFDQVRIKNTLTNILGVEADLSDASAPKEEIRSNFDREAELVF